MADVDKTAVSQMENVSDKPRRRGCLGHCAKFWWAYLIFVIVVVVVVVPVVLLVAVPKIAQSKIDDAVLTLEGITVSNTQAGNMTMAINSTITTDGSVHADIDGFEGVMYLEDHPAQTPFARIQFPATTADKLQTVNVTQFVAIDDVAALTTFNTWLLANETLRVTVRGDTQVKVKGISRSYGVTFKKTITMPGLSHLDGTIVKPTWINITNDENGNNMRADVIIPNRSLVAFEMGNVTFTNYLLGKDVGTVYIDNLTLLRGNNTFKMRASVDTGSVITALGQKPYCENNGVLPFQISGKTVVNHGQSLSYFRDALASSNQTVTIPVGEAVNASLHIVVPCSNKRSTFLF